MCLKDKRNENASILSLKYKGKGKKRQCREFYGDLNCGLLRFVLINPSIKFYSNSLMMSTNVKITKMLLFVQVHFLNFPSPLCKRRQLLNKFDFQTRLFLSRVVSNETLQVSIELIALIKQNKLPCSHFDISVSGGAKKMVQTADKHTEISNVSKMNQSSFRWLSNSYI